MAESRFQANALPLLIGSLPGDNHEAAIELVFDYTPQIPLWPQLPANPRERMVPQFATGMPGLVFRGDTPFVNTAQLDFDAQLLLFYEDYVAAVEDRLDFDQSRFAFTEEVGKGFYLFLQRVETLIPAPIALKGQVTGPLTFCTGVSDGERRAIFYNTQLRDAAVKLLAVKAGWQTRRLMSFGLPVIVFLDEPALAGYGSSEQIGISRDEVDACLEEVIAAVHAEGGLAGVHVCANTDWSLVLESSVDIVNFDAYGYFDRFILYAESLKRFLRSGRFLAWGIVPTQRAEDIDRESVDSLTRIWQAQAAQVLSLGIERRALLSQSLITPSCGAGSLSLAHASRVLELTREVSEKIRADEGLAAK